MIKNNIIVIVLALFILYLVFTPFLKFAVRMNLDIKPDRVEKMFLKCPFILNQAIEYEDKETIILGGVLSGLPVRNGKINIQVSIRDTGDSCNIVIGYPALPLESY